MRILLIALLVLAGIVPARAADLKLLTAGAFKPVAVEIVAEFEKRTGNRVTIDNDTAADSPSAWRPANISTSSSCRRWCWGRSSAASWTKAAPSRWPAAGIGVAVKEGAAKPDLSSVDSFKKALLAARSVGYVDPASGGSSGIYLAKLFETMIWATLVELQRGLVQSECPHPFAG